MKKRFNVTGVCFPDQHYMADTSAKFARIFDMVEMGEYFAINRPRQYGKTTMLFRLAEALAKNGQYTVFRISFEGIGGVPFENEETFCPVFLDLLRKRAKLAGNQTLVDFFDQHKSTVSNLEALSEFISDLALFCTEKMVLLIDEVDKSSNNQLFLHFLGMLRDKYLARAEQPTFHSIILVGIHDVKSLKLKIRPENEKKLNSPWNIAVDFKVDMNLHPHEIRPMLEEYAQDRAVQLDSKALAERLFYYTSGYPFLVSKLCQIFDEEMLPQKTEQTWTVHDLDLAARQLVGEDTVNFQDLVKNLRNNPDLYELVEKILIEGQEFSFNLNAETVNLGLTYGVFANQNGRLAIHNRIYREVIFNYMSVNAELRSPIAGREFSGSYRLPGDHFDLRRALLKFQELVRIEYAQKDRNFLERQGRLIFLTFLKPLLNGHGHAFKETQSSEEKRLDIVIAYYRHQYVVELKIWRGPEAHQRGLDQLAGYLDDLGLDEGFLLIFDHSKTPKGDQADILHKGKHIFAVWA